MNMSGSVLVKNHRPKSVMVVKAKGKHPPLIHTRTRWVTKGGHKKAKSTHILETKGERVPDSHEGYMAGEVRPKNLREMITEGIERSHVGKKPHVHKFDYGGQQLIDLYHNSGPFLSDAGVSDHTHGIVARMQAMAKEEMDRRIDKYTGEKGASEVLYKDQHGRYRMREFSGRTNQARGPIPDELQSDLNLLNQHMGTDTATDAPPPRDAVEGPTDALEDSMSTIPTGADTATDSPPDWQSTQYKHKPWCNGTSMCGNDCNPEGNA